jgi:hypothetical protein
MNLLPGGSFVNSGYLQAGDLVALAQNSITATLPSGYGVFADFSTTYQVQQQYLITPPTTPTGFARSFLFGRSATDDGTGSGFCSEHASLNIAGFIELSGAPISIPITSGEPITGIETATVTCSKYSAFGFGDGGLQQAFTGLPFFIYDYDANGNLLGQGLLPRFLPSRSPFCSWP